MSLIAPVAAFALRPLSEVPPGSLVLLERPVEIAQGQGSQGPFLVISCTDSHPFGLVGLEQGAAHRMMSFTPQEVARVRTIVVHRGLDLMLAPRATPVRADTFRVDFYGGICVTADGPFWAVTERGNFAQEQMLRFVSFATYATVALDGDTYANAPWLNDWSLSRAGLAPGERIAVSEFAPPVMAR